MCQYDGNSHGRGGQRLVMALGVNLVLGCRLEGAEERVWRYPFRIIDLAPPGIHFLLPGALTMAPPRKLLRSEPEFCHENTF